MIGAANIRKQLAADACTIVYGPVDKLLKTIGRKGNITADEGDKLSKKLKISVDVVKREQQNLALNGMQVVAQKIIKQHTTSITKQNRKMLHHLME